MPVRLVQVNLKARDDGALGRFWAQALGWVASSAEGGATGAAPAGFVWTDPDAPVCLDIVAVPEPETVRGHLHIELTTTSAAQHSELVTRLKTLGATPADKDQRNAPRTVLTDPEGNEFCVLEP